MNANTQLLNEEIYPRIFEDLENAFPEFGFKRVPGKGYISTTEQKVTGELGKKGKVYVYENNLSYFKDWSRSPINYYDYLIERDGLDQRQAFIKLAQLANFPLTNDHLSTDALKAVTEAHQRAKLWEDVNSFFMHALSHQGDQFAESAGAKSVRLYLEDERGYKANVFQSPLTKPDRDNPKMEVGFVPSVQDLLYHLVHEAGHQAAEVSNLITDGRIGTTHRLAIPFRDPSGRIQGMVFRATTGSTPKYLYSTDLAGKRSSLLFNLKALKGDRDLIIVEGVLDALHATAVGLPNVVAIGGSGDSLSSKHIESAIKYGARRITLLLDNDEAGIKGTLKALDTIRRFPRIKAYIAFVDPEYKDLDRLLTLDGGLERAKLIITNAVPAWMYLQDQIFAKYQLVQDDRLAKDPDGGGLTAKDIDDLVDDVVETAAGLSRLESEPFTRYFLGLEYIQFQGITQLTLDTVVEELRAARQKKERMQSTKTLLNEARDHLEKGNLDAALNRLSTGSQDIRGQDREAVFSSLGSCVTEQEMANRLRNKPPGLTTSFIINGEALELPSGALTIIAGPTSHGKTTILNNLALDVVKLNPDKKYYLLSYEEDEDIVRLKALSAFIDKEISIKNLSAIQHYFTTGELRYIKEEHRSMFIGRKDRFFAEIIGTGRYNVRYVDYDSDALNEAIYYLAKDPNTGGIFVDYAQMLNKPDNKYNSFSRQEELKQICLDLKDTAVDTGLPIVLGAQFNRKVTHHLAMHATMIGEAGDIERAANLIIGIWNNQYEPFGASEAQLKEISQKGYDEPESIYVKVLKFRGGRPNVWDTWDYNGNLWKISNKAGSVFVDPIPVSEEMNF